MSLRDEDRLLRRTQAQAQSSRYPRSAAVVHAPKPSSGRSSGRSRRLQENRGGALAKQQGAAGTPAMMQRPQGSLFGRQAQPQRQLAVHQAAACAEPHIVPSGGRRREVERGAKQVWG